MTQEVVVGSYLPIFTLLTKYKKVVQVVENVFDILKQTFFTWKWFVKLSTSSPILNTCMQNLIASYRHYHLPS